MEIIKVILTALLSISSLFIITKIMGHKQVAQLDFFDYISGITIGSIGAELATELEEPYKPLIALCVWGGVSLILQFELLFKPFFVSPDSQEIFPHDTPVHDDLHTDMCRLHRDFQVLGRCGAV